MKDLLKNSSILGVGHGAKIILNIIRVKAVALLLEPSGLGILAQLNSFNAVLNRISDLGIGSGVTKYTAEYHSKEHRDKLEQLIYTSFVCFLGMGALVVAICVLFNNLFSSWLLGDTSYGSLVAIVAFSALFKVQVNVITRIFQGLLKMKKVVKLSIFGVMVGVAFSLPLIYFFGLTGAVVALLCTNVILLFVAVLWLKKALVGIVDYRSDSFKFDRKTLVNLLKFGGANTTVFLSTTVTLIIIRSIIIQDIGEEESGWYQLAVGVSTQYLGLVSISIWQYGMPKVATLLGQKMEIQILQNDALRLSLIVLTPIVVGLLATREIWIPLLYSKKFLPAYGLLSWQLLGELFRAMKWGPNMVNQPYERYRFIIFQSVMNSALFFLFFFLLIDQLGVLAAPLGYCIAQACMVVITYSGHYYYDKFLPQMKNALLALSAIGLVGFTMYITNARVEFIDWLKIGMMVVLTLIWLGVVTTKDERGLVTNLILKFKK